MEPSSEQPNPAVENQTSSDEKKGKFLSSWLRRRQPEAPQTTEVAETPPESEPQESKVEQFFKNLGEKLSGTSVDMVPETVTTDADVEDEEIPKPTEHIIDLPEVPDIDETEFQSTEKEEGFVPISKEAIKRYQPSDTLPRVVPDPEAPIVEPEKTKVIREKEIEEKVKIVNESVDHPIMPTNTLALSTGEILRRQRERQLRREVKKIRQEAKDTERKQKEMIEQQTEFQNQLDEQAVVRKKTSEKQAEELKKSLEAFKALPVELPSPEKPSLKTEPAKLKTELEPVKLKEIVSAPPPERPDVILHTVEEAADKNVAIESLYERRHEIRGSTDVGSQDGASSGHLAQPIVSKLRKNGFYQNPLGQSSSRPDFQPQPMQSTSPRQVQDKDLYRQAALSGFFAAIILFAIILLLAT